MVRQVDVNGSISVRLPFLEDHPMTDGYVVNNHADRFRPPRIGLWNPLQMAILWHIYMYIYINHMYTWGLQTTYQVG